MAARPATKLNSLLVTRPRYRQGRPCLRGTGIRVHQVAAAYLLGFTADEICRQNPDLDASLFYAALSYYFANRAEIDADLERDRIEDVQMAAQYPEGITPATFTQTQCSSSISMRTPRRWPSCLPCDRRVSTV